METHKDALALLEKDPTFQALPEKKEVENLKVRRAAAAAVKKTQKELEAELPPLRNVVAEVEQELKSHAEIHVALMDKLRAAKLALAQEQGRLERVKNETEKVLLTTYDQSIDEAIEFFRTQFENIRQRSVHHDRHGADLDLIHLTKKFRNRSNYPAICAGLVYCREAIDALEVAKLQPKFAVDKIEALKKNIPDTNEMTETDTEKPMAGSKGFRPRDLLPSDDQLDFEMEQLDAKFKKVIKR